ncbi:MAG: hypothetical protein KDB86_11660 [Actinobacteria bacterium]|nr:hypothetical protein [Actinomycetota bacterium]MCB9388029.1 hypothetical protein [Acidimicrobiia bacterium]
MALVDFTKKIHKHCKDDLEPGEQVVASTFGQPPGAIRQQVARGFGGAVGVLASNALASNRDSDDDNPGDGIMLNIPAGKAVLGLSDRRLLVFGHSSLSGRPKGLNASIPLDQITSLDAEMGKATGTLVITFVDGTTTSFDVAKTAGPGAFADKFTELTGR